MTGPGADHYDVVVIGAGPTGLTAANLLAHAGIRTLLVEREPDTVQQPRAVSIDDESLRTLQAAGVVGEVLADVALDYGNTIIGVGGRRLYDVHPTTREYGYPRRNAFVQPVLAATLRRAFERRPTAVSLFGWSVTRIDDSADGDGVRLHLAGPQGATRQVPARYVVGADGAHSLVREAIGARLAGSTYEQRWLIVDLAGTKDRYRQGRGISDGHRGLVDLPGPDGRRRFEFLLAPGEDEATATGEAFVRDLLRRYGPDGDSEIVRTQVYTFHARVADRWQRGNLFLAGDAAHLTPPFAGQGMNSGIRDAHNLAWKLTSVIRGEFGPHLLATYQPEREPHARELIGLAIANGRLLMRTSPWRGYLGDIVRRAAQRVPAVAEYYRQLKRKPKALYANGFAEQPAAGPHTGRLIPQPRLELLDRSVVLMDDLLGGGFALVVLGRDAQDAAAALTTALQTTRQTTRQTGRDGDRCFPAALPVVAVTPWNYNLDPHTHPRLAGRDLDATLVHLAPDDVHVMLVRPDRYVALERRWTGHPGPVLAALTALTDAWRTPATAREPATAPAPQPTT